MSDVITPLDVRKPEDQPIDIIDYEFTYIGDRGAITVFPSMGDTVKVFTDRWEFSFGRLDAVETVYKTMMLTKVRVTKVNRVYIDPNELVRRVKDERQRRQTEAREAREKKEREINGEEVKASQDKDQSEAPNQ